MNILYIIGNGFDLAQNLKTSYQHFYNYLVHQEPINSIEVKMLEQIKGDEHEKWSDMEYALGQFTKDISDKEEFENFYYELCNQLKTYLMNQVNDFKVTEHLIDKFTKDLVRPDYYLSPREQLRYDSYFRNFIETRYINIVSFNYTDVVDKCLDINHADRELPANNYAYKINHVSKIHGTLDTPYLLMGVNDQKQIVNSEFAKDEDILDYLVKPRSNYGIGTRVDDYVTQDIASAHLIVTMGLSFGETDSIWWQTIGKRLISSNLHIIIFAYEKEFPSDERKKLRIKRKIRKDFLTKCGIATDIQSNYEEKIIVCINSGMFSSQGYFFQDDRKGL